MRHTLIKLLVFWGALTLSSSVLSNPASGATVLMYHHFGESRFSSTNVTLQQFDAHLHYLEQNHFKIWPLEKIIKRLETGHAFPDRVVAITIDDAYRSIYTHAYPRLKKRGWPFTVFVSTDPIDKQMPAFMSWDQMREMQQHGASFANHTTHHDFLINRKENETADNWRLRIRHDLKTAQQRLQTELGSAPALFAYPYGEYHSALQQIVQDLGWSAFGQQSGVVSQYSDRLALPRYPMAAQFAALPSFKTRVMSLPLPVINASPVDTIIKQQNPPRLQLTLAQDDDVQTDQLNCFASNQEAAKVTWVDKEKGRFSVKADKPFNSRRSRYNCTAPSKRSGRYYWYSHLWISPTPGSSNN
ncbi:MAG: polysaccharide deacetylase family protein [Gammaproteobacteria bacterium]|nr:polysaccharide deacetylase family protein [Gammaproteobacteria bacterium]